MTVNKQQVDNLVSMLDGYVEQGGHHLNVNVFTKETLLPRSTPKNIRSSLSVYRDMP